MKTKFKKTETKKNQEIISVKNVSFSYGKEELLKSISFSVYEKDFLGIIGPNGGGKTTLLRLIMGLLKPTKGKITVIGDSPRLARKKIGYLSQFKDIDFSFPITAYDIILQSRIKESLISRFKKQDHKAVEDAMNQLGIWNLKSKTLAELSGGEKQRVFVARALANNPQVLILDEPMANVDIHTQESFYKILTELNKKIAIVIVDHDIDMVSRYAKEIVCVNRCSTHTVKYHDSDSLKMKEICNV